MVRERVCAACGLNFSYEVGSGRDRKYCSLLCRKSFRSINQNLRWASLDTCSIEGCLKKANRVQARMCEKHYVRFRRQGHTDDRKILGRYTTTAGYIKLLKPNHPLADSKGQVFEHRYVVYELVTNKSISCYWCGLVLNWDSAVIDHLNECKSDNRVENLVVSCNGCNRARGAIKGFIGGLSQESLETFLECTKQYHIQINRPKDG